MKWKKLILLGDSNTQFGYSDESKWISLLSNSLQRKCDVVNRGFSGYNTDHIKTILPKILEEFDAESTCGIIIMLGSNDSSKNTNKLQHVPVDRYKTNLAHILDDLISFCKSKEKIILISPPRINETKWKEITDSKNEECTHLDNLVVNYARASIEIATEKSVKYLDLNKIMHDYGESYEELLIDGLHLSPKGGLLLFNSLLPIFNKQIGSFLKFQFPYWKDLLPNQEKIDQ